MLDENTVQGLKQNNISKDGEKTKQRVRDLWMAAAKPDREKVEKLAGLAPSTVARVYKTGSISAKLAAAFAQIFNVDPSYLTGETDEQGESTDALLLDFLSRLGYKNLKPERAASGKRGRKNARQPEAENTEAVTPETEDEIALRFDAEVRAEIAAAAEEYRKTYESAEPSSATVLSLPVMSADAGKVSQDFLNAMTEDDMILLLRGIMYRAKAGAAAELADTIKRLLLS